jgi:hypothetical protein
MRQYISTLEINNSTMLKENESLRAQNQKNDDLKLKVSNLESKLKNAELLLKNATNLDAERTELNENLKMWKNTMQDLFGEDANNFARVLGLISDLKRENETIVLQLHESVEELKSAYASVEDLRRKNS